MQMFADKHKQTTEDERKKKQNKNRLPFQLEPFHFQSPRWKYSWPSAHKEIKMLLEWPRKLKIIQLCLDINIAILTFIVYLKIMSRVQKKKITRVTRVQNNQVTG